MHGMLACRVGHIIKHTVVHRPVLAAPLRILGILDVTHLAFFVKILHGYTMHRLRVRIVKTSVHQAANLAMLYVLDDNMLLGLHHRVALYLVVYDVAVCGIRPRHDVFVKGNGNNAYHNAQYNRRRGNARKTNAA